MRINIYKKIDKFFGGMLCVFIYVIKKPMNNVKFFFSSSKKKRILVIKLWALGDSIVLLPLINSLKKNHSNAEIDVLARKRNKDVFKFNKDINKVLLFEPKQFIKTLLSFKKYDLVFDTEPYLNLSALLSVWFGKTTIGFSNQTRSILYDYQVPHKKDNHMVQNYLNMSRIIGLNTDYSRLIPINTCEEEKRIAKIFLSKFKEKKVGFCVGTAESASKTRLWQDEKWAKLGDELSKKGFKVIFVGSKNEEEKIKNIASLMQSKPVIIAGKYSILETAEIIKGLDLFVSIDTGPMHLAAAQGVKTIGLFGPNTPTLWAPYGKENISIYKNLPCSPCIINDKGIMPDCSRKKDKYACMKQVSVEEVLDGLGL